MKRDSRCSLYIFVLAIQNADLCYTKPQSCWRLHCQWNLTVVPEIRDRNLATITNMISYFVTSCFNSQNLLFRNGKPGEMDKMGTCRQGYIYLPNRFMPRILPNFFIT
jgi:hypothetical protein